MNQCKKTGISNVAEEGEEHSIIWGMFVAVTMNSATFMWKNFQDNQNSIVNTTDLTQCSIGQDEIFKCAHGNIMSLIGDESHQSLILCCVDEGHWKDMDPTSQDRE